MPVKVQMSTVCHGLSSARSNLSLATLPLSSVNFQTVSDSIFDQFIGVHIIRIVQQYFKVTITNQFGS